MSPLANLHCLLASHSVSDHDLASCSLRRRAIRSDLLYILQSDGGLMSLCQSICSRSALLYPKQGDRAWEEMRGCSHRCPQDAVGLRNLGGSWPANVTQDAGAAELIAFLGEIRSASVGGRLSCSSARKRGVGFTVLECPRELAVSPDLPTDSI